jgi:hypothetical protein
MTTQIRLRLSTMVEGNDGLLAQKITKQLASYSRNNEKGDSISSPPADLTF